MQQYVTELDPAWGKPCDFDVRPDGSWVGLFEQEGTHNVHMSSGSGFSVPSLAAYPLVRFVGPDNILIVDGPWEWKAAHSSIHTPDGVLISAFSCGSGLVDAIVLGDMFAVTYCDEGIFRLPPPSAEGVAFFDHQGRLVSGYQSLMGAAAVEIADCYCACRVDAETLAFSPYTEFPLVIINPRTRAQQVRVLPGELEGARALSVRGETWFFFSPRTSTGVVFAWEPGNLPREVGRRTGKLRGLDDGRFLSLDRGGFTITSFEIE